MVSEDKAGDIVNAAPGDCNAIQVEMRSLLGHWSHTAIDLYIVQGTKDEFSSLSWNSGDADEDEMDFLAGARGSDSAHGVDDDECDEVIDERWDNEGELAEISGEPSIPPSAGQRRKRAKPARPARPGDDADEDQQAEDEEDECMYDFVEYGGPMFDVRCCEPAWGRHLILPCGRALHVRWVGSHGGQVWQDAVGREVGKALFAGANNIRVSCWCHGTDSSLGAVTSGPACGGMLYCAGVWEHINEVLSCFFDLGTRYVVGLPPGQAAEQRRHHRETFALVLRRMAEIRAARRVSGNAVAPGVPRLGDFHPCGQAQHTL